MRLKKLQGLYLSYSLCKVWSNEGARASSMCMIHISMKQGVAGEDKQVTPKETPLRSMLQPSKKARKKSSPAPPVRLLTLVEPWGCKALEEIWSGSDYNHNRLLAHLQSLVFPFIQHRVTGNVNIAVQRLDDPGWYGGHVREDRNNGAWRLRLSMSPPHTFAQPQPEGTELSQGERVSLQDTGEYSLDSVRQDTHTWLDKAGAALRQMDTESTWN